MNLREIEKKLSEHFTEKEFLNSKENSKNAWETNIHKSNAIILCKNYLEPIRKLLGGEPLIITSGYRNHKTNTLAGGVPSSAHLYGLAVDFYPKFMDVKKAYNMIMRAFLRAELMPHDQLIFEIRGGSPFMHLGICINTRHGRKEFLYSPTYGEHIHIKGGILI